MSHFTVLVIGPNVEEQLQPYHEYECTGTKDKYVCFVEESREELVKEYESEHKVDYSTFEDFIRHYHGYEINEAGKIGGWTNPNRKWDWWVLGGRWTGMLKLKEGAKGDVGRPGLMTAPAMPGYCDSAFKKDIDFEGMRRKEGSQAFVTFAVVKDGKWYERGKMGWWCAISDEKPDDQWEKEFGNLIDGLPDDTLFTIVDCHI